MTGDHREGSEHLARILESVSTGELALHRVVMHDDHPRVIRGRSLELLTRAIDLRPLERADDGDVLEAPGERVARHALRGVEPDEGRAGDAQHGLEIFRDVLPIRLVWAILVPDAKRCLPPHDIVVSGHDNRLAHPMRVADERLRGHEFTGVRALRQITRDRHDIEAAFLDERFDGLDLLGDRWPSEVQIGHMKHRQRHPTFGSHASRAMMASENCAVFAVPPRSRVTVFRSRITLSMASRMRRARAWSFRCSSIRHAA